MTAADHELGTSLVHVLEQPEDAARCRSAAASGPRGRLVETHGKGEEVDVIEVASDSRLPRYHRVANLQEVVRRRQGGLSLRELDEALHDQESSSAAKRTDFRIPPG